MRRALRAASVPRGARWAATAILLASLAPASHGLAGTPKADWGMSRDASTTVSRPGHSWLGVVITVEDSAPAAPETVTAPGVSIAGISPGGPADAAGLHENDVLLALGGMAIRKPTELRAALNAHEPGQQVEATVLRGGRVVRIPVRLASPPEGLPEQRRIVVPPVAALPDDGLSLRFGGDRPRADMGLETTSMEPGLSAYFGTPKGQGVLVSRVAPDSPAAHAGLRAGDVLLAMDGGPVKSPASIATFLRTKEPGDSVLLEIVRSGTRQAFVVALNSRDVPVWVAESHAEPGSPEDATDGLHELIDHQRREAEHLQGILDAWHDHQALPAGEGPSRPSSRDVVALKDQIAELRAKLRSLETKLAERRAKAPPAPRESTAHR